MYAILLAVLACGQCESHRIVSSERETTRFYIGVVLPNGYRTEVPVINGYLPNIERTPYCDHVDLSLDYSSRIVYNPQKHGNPVKYAKPQPARIAVQEPQPPLEEISPPIQEIRRPMPPTPPAILPEPVPEPLVEIKKPEAPPPEPPQVETWLQKPSSIPDVGVRFAR